MTARRDASRREALKTAAIGASGVVVAVAVSRAARTPAAPAATAAQQQPNENGAAAPAGPTYLAELAGVHFGAYRVVSVGAIERGGVPVWLSFNEGAAFRVDVLRADPTAGSTGIGAVSSHSVYLRNGGNGRTSTDESMGLGAMALAEELSARERAGLKPPAALLTMDERSALDASAARVT